MTIERKNISSLFKHSLGIRRANEDTEFGLWQQGYLIVYRRDNGKIIATVQEDDIFDEDGNRFYGDA